jgi:D-alanyl-lipoteichoic acid acyltransferase DltB (MBOAT superfamily)
MPVRLVNLSFISSNFLWFVLELFAAYFATPKRYRWIVLLIASYIFFLLVNFWLVIFILITSISVYLSARFFEKINDKSKSFFADKDENWLAENKQKYQKKFRSKKRLVVWLVLLLNFGFLFFFKYFEWIAGAVNGLLGAFQFSLSVGDLDLLMPLGISFYTFQAVGYLSDVYRGQQRAEKNPFRFALFVSFFPQLVQGPISRFNQLAPQLFEGHAWEWRRVKDGLLLVLWGFFKKLCIAETAYLVYRGILGSNIDSFYGMELIVGVLFFMIYGCCDFSGGIDIARGIAQILGINMVKNFNRPYFSTSLRDHWTRWHITLREWIRDYVMYPITLTKTYNKFNKKFRTWFPNSFGKIFPFACVLFFVYFLIGVWHGPNFKYIMFGCYNGIIIVTGLFIAEPLKKWGRKYPGWNRNDSKTARILLVIMAFVLIFFGKSISASSDAGAALNLWWRMLTSWQGGMFSDFLTRVDVDSNILISMFAAFTVLFLVSLIEEIKNKDIRELIAKCQIHTRWAIYFALIVMLILFSMPSDGVFLYEKF